MVVGVESRRWKILESNTSSSSSSSRHLVYRILDVNQGGGECWGWDNLPTKSRPLILILMRNFILISSRGHPLFWSPHTESRWESWSWKIFLTEGWPAILILVRNFILVSLWGHFLHCVLRRWKCWGWNAFLTNCRPSFLILIILVRNFILISSEDILANKILVWIPSGANSGRTNRSGRLLFPTRFPRFSFEHTGTRVAIIIREFWLATVPDLWLGNWKWCKMLWLAGLYRVRMHGW